MNTPTTKAFPLNDLWWLSSSISLLQTPTFSRTFSLQSFLFFPSKHPHVTQEAKREQLFGNGRSTRRQWSARTSLGHSPSWNPSNQLSPLMGLPRRPSRLGPASPSWAWLGMRGTGRSLTRVSMLMIWSLSVALMGSSRIGDSCPTLANAGILVFYFYGHFFSLEFMEFVVKLVRNDYFFVCFMKILVPIW